MQKRSIRALEQTAEQETTIAIESFVEPVKKWLDNIAKVEIFPENQQEIRRKFDAITGSKAQLECLLKIIASAINQQGPLDQYAKVAYQLLKSEFRGQVTNTTIANLLLGIPDADFPKAAWWQDHSAFIDSETLAELFTPQSLSIGPLQI